MRAFSTLLVANRGEIARRVIRGARSLGLRTVAVHSDADTTAAHVREADVAVRLGPTPAAESYLSIEAILRACELSGADAVHPGYGFLSERSAFAQAVTDAGLVFVGPSAAVMEAMGRKDRAREIAERAGVAVVPRLAAGVPRGGPIGTGVPLDNAEPSQPHPQAYPVLVKAAAGGGGKGMRIVRDPADLDAAIEAAGREATSAFGDGTLLIEQYVEQGRHVEVQIIADHHGTVLHLFERDCSVQRRHQKVLEEAPASMISAAVRRLLHDSAVALAREVGYVNAGTVEFLVAGDQAYFLEMNTRLQVEHPVTEEVTGLDLVALQLRVAAGEPLGLTQEQVVCEGHAIEARVYAEDVPAGFLPAAGRADVVQWPAGVRIDAALEPGQEVGTAYDPMLGKIIALGPTREAARRRLVDALDATGVIGLTTNLGFLRRMADSPAFAAGEVHTAWLDSDPAAVDVTALPELPPEVLAICAWALLRVAGTEPTHPFGAADGWRVAGPAASTLVRLWHRGEALTARVHTATGDVELSGGTVRVVRVDRTAGRVRLSVDGVTHDLAVHLDSATVSVVWQGQTWTLERDTVGVDHAERAGDADVVSPMPGTVLAVHVAQGEAVVAGQALGVLEAMKMELTLTAAHDGVLRRVSATVGARVPLGQVLFTVDPVAAS
ncbi:MAG: ATP-grasp domain-containing protein [Actinomycetota bacterium]|nr:ATP-grasp domain-containing protein [Actinomycetota bacterium]